MSDPPENGSSMPPLVLFDKPIPTQTHSHTHALNTNTHTHTLILYTYYVCTAKGLGLVSAIQEIVNGIPYM